MTTTSGGNVTFFFFLSLTSSTRFVPTVGMVFGIFEMVLAGGLGLVLLPLLPDLSVVGVFFSSVACRDLRRADFPHPRVPTHNIIA